MKSTARKQPRPYAARAWFPAYCRATASQSPSRWTPREIKPLIYTPNSYIVEFDFDGKKEQAVLREAQFHPVREQILHLDFYRIADGKPVSIAIPVDRKSVV